MSTFIAHFSLASEERVVAEISVVRQDDYYHTPASPSADDVPADIRQALIDWLTPQSPDSTSAAGSATQEGAAE